MYDLLTTDEQIRLDKLEAVINRGLQTFAEVGAALAEIRDSRLYKNDYSTFEDYCKSRWGMTRQHANRTIAAAEVIVSLEPMGSNLPASERQARPLTKLEPEQRRQVWRTAVDTAPNGKITAAHVQRVADRLPLTAANHAVSDTPGYDGDEWYTPAKFTDAAREVMAGIDLDPASCEAAQGVIRATDFFTKEDDGLQQSWHGRVWLNPPYSMPLIEQFVDKLIAEYENGNVSEAVIITNNSSDTGWFHKLLSRFPACFTRGRARFWRPNHESFGTRQGQALFYLGKNPARFASVFSRFGVVVTGYDH